MVNAEIEASIRDTVRQRIGVSGNGGNLTGHAVGAADVTYRAAEKCRQGSFAPEPEADNRTISPA